MILRHPLNYLVIRNATGNSAYGFSSELSFTLSPVFVFIHQSTCFFIPCTLYTVQCTLVYSKAGMTDPSRKGEPVWFLSEKTPRDLNPGPTLQQAGTLSKALRHTPRATPHSLEIAPGMPHRYWLGRKDVYWAVRTSSNTPSFLLSQWRTDFYVRLWQFSSWLPTIVRGGAIPSKCSHRLGERRTSLYIPLLHPVEIIFWVELFPRSVLNIFFIYFARILNAPRLGLPEFWARGLQWAGL